jgi:hypothetical protein
MALFLLSISMASSEELTMMMRWPKTEVEMMGPCIEGISRLITGRSGAVHTVFFAPFREGSPFVLGGHLKHIAYERKTSWPRRIRSRPGGLVLES